MTLTAHEMYDAAKPQPCMELDMCFKTGSELLSVMGLVANSVPYIYNYL